MYQALYRKWRPQAFDDVCGQEHITSILKHQTENNSFSHAYLFCGSRGTGKTTCAKILSKAVNCESPVNGSPCNKCAACRAIDAGSATDVLEMDAASNNGVDNIRDIRDEVVYTPSALKYRVYIVDEVHMLTGSAFNALLKTLEEPPSHVIFILATTELHKLPATIVSRCQRFDFRRIATEVLKDRLAYISDRENIEYDADALRIIAKMAQGGMRDAISLLELCSGTKSRITADIVEEVLGTGGRAELENAVRAIARSDFDSVFSTVDTVVRSSRDISVFWQDLLSFYRDMLVVKTTADAQKYLDLTENEYESLKKTAQLFTKEALLYHCRTLDDALYNMQRAGMAKRTVAEMTLVKIMDNSLDTSAEALAARISKLENAFAAGIRIADTDMGDKKEEFINEENTPASTLTVAETVNKNEAPMKNIAEDQLRVLRGWYEICTQAAAGDMANLALMKQGKAFTDGNGKIYIRFANDAMASMVNKAPLNGNIRASLCIALQRDIKDSDIIYGVLDGGEEKETDLDEFNF